MNYSKPRGGYYANIQLLIIVNLEGDIIMNYSKPRRGYYYEL